MPTKAASQTATVRILALTAIAAVAACGGGKSSATSTPTPAEANGRAIFQTGKDLSGVQIVAATRPLENRCAACHRPDGSGGKHLPRGAVSADLRHAALASGKHPYTLALLERAISTGVDNEGEPLNPVMPRWKLSQPDLHDVASYVFTRLK